MVAESRKHARAEIPAVDVRYAGAGGEVVAARAADLGRGGLFVATAAPLAVGKRIDFELQVAGEALPIMVVARVAWVRTEADAAAGPPGMGLSFIDVEEAALERIAELVAGRERTIQGLGQGSTTAAPPAATELPRDTIAELPLSRETTIGMGVAPPANAGPLREPTLLGVIRDAAAGPAALEREASIPIGLVARKPSPAAGAATGAEGGIIPRARAASVVDEPEPRRRGGLVVAAAVVLALGAGVVFRGRLVALVAPAPTASAASGDRGSSAIATDGPSATWLVSSASADAGSRDASVADASVADAAIVDAALADAAPVLDASAHDAAARAPRPHVTTAPAAHKPAATTPRPKPAPTKDTTKDEENPY